MTIQILPAQLANQIAAGEVVERPASVVKELVENSLDAGATQIDIVIEKGGAKQIKITDNGCGIAQEQLALALSRHATSKIKDFADLEAIASMGFRGEALASISSVARLTLISKPAAQANAWQAQASGRDMQVQVQPAAHPNGTTVDIQDLFFNTPARRKFLRTEKTEFNHIDEVVKRIALARFDVGFNLVHNGKRVRQYRAIAKAEQFNQRIGKVCGQAFIENALYLDCKHDGMHLWGWIATPSFTRVQNDLCYSYVNQRMMRDKLINHAIRQAYGEQISTDSYPAFVLYLNLEHKEVDVNVHPAKHEVRFHQARLVHDFIYTVTAQALAQQQLPTGSFTATSSVDDQMNDHDALDESVYPSAVDYIKPLQSTKASAQAQYRTNHPSKSELAHYHQLLSTVNEPAVTDIDQVITENSAWQWLSLVENEQGVALVKQQQSLYLLDLPALLQHAQLQQIKLQWHNGLVSQPLLLPLTLKLSQAQANWLSQYGMLLEQAGIVLNLMTHHQVQVRQFPALLRQKDVQTSLVQIIEAMLPLSDQASSQQVTGLQQQLAKLASQQNFDEKNAKTLFEQAKTSLGEKFNQQLALNSAKLDLRSQITLLKRS